MNEDLQTTESTEVNQEAFKPSVDNTIPAQERALLEWAAPEFIAHQKGSKWYLVFSAVAVAVAAIIWLLTRDEISAGLVLLGAVVIAVYAARQPRVLPYSVSEHGVTIGPRYHAYEDFRSFGVVPEGELSSIVFMPLKRFAQTLTIYFAPEMEEEIVRALTDRIPYEEHKHDLVDSFMRTIRF